MTFSLGQSQTPAAGPTSPPTRNPWDVLSQYGSQYTNPPNLVFDSFGGSNIIGDVTLADNSVVKKYINHSYSGISANSNVTGIYAADMTHMHIDVWSPDFASFKIKLEGVNGSNRELEVPGAKVQNSWNSYDLDLTTYTSGPGGVDLANLKWIVPVTFGPNNTTLFITNVYFYRPPTTQPPTFGSFTVAPQLVGSPDFNITPPTSNSAGAFSYTSSNTNVATIVNGNQIHIVGGGSSVIVATQAANGSYGSGTTSATFLATYPLPGPSPIPPPRAPSNVVSMFTGNPPTYANPVGYSMVRAFWTAGTTLTTIPNGANTCLQVDNFGYLGYITDGANFSALGMTKLHIDIYLNAPLANMFIFLLSNGDKNYNTGPMIAGWNSLDISLSTYTNQGANLGDIYGFKFEQNVGPPIQMYLDNIYFYVSNSEPVLTNFSIPNKASVDPDFTITPPTSNSSGAFSYISSNTSVATIVNGNQIHIVGGGSSTITANQAATGSFESGSITATFVVSYPAPGPSPIPPSRAASDVVSMFTGNPPAYADPVGYNMVRSDWTAGTTLTTIPNGTNTCLQVDNLGYLGYVTSTEPVRFSVSGMTKLHLDIYLNAPLPNLFIFLLANGDHLYNTGSLPAGWNSIDITLASAFPSAILNNIYGFKFEQNVGPPIQMYLDNVYFWRPPSNSTVNLKLFIEGYYSGASTMIPVKNNQDGASPLDEVEVITVELHHATTYSTLYTTTATLKTNGTAVCTFPPAASGSYYIVVKNSNAVQTWSATTQTVGAIPLAYDFGSCFGSAIVGIRHDR